MNSGNYLIDGDDGRHPFSPSYREETCDGCLRAPCICNADDEDVEYCTCDTPDPDPGIPDLCATCNREIAASVVLPGAVRVKWNDDGLMDVLMYSSYVAQRGYGMTHEQCVSIGLARPGFLEKFNFKK